MEQRQMDGTAQEAAFQEALARVLGGGRAEAVFGEPRTVGDKMIIPVAVLSYSGGGGGGVNQESPGATQGRSRGFGFGGTLTARPVAVIEASPQGTRVVPVVDVGQFVMGAMLLSFAAFAVFRIFRRR